MRFRWKAIPSLLRVVLVLVLLPVQLAPACSIFALTQDGKTYFANNEDYLKRGVIWFVPGNEKRLGRVNVGFDKDFAQGSMNEKGLAFDAAALQPVPWEADPARKDTKNLLELIMDTCATVDEALAMFNEYNCKHLADGQFLFADAAGASAVVTWAPWGGISVVRGGDGPLLCTNDRLEASQYRDKRFVKATQLLSSNADLDPADRARDVLDAIHQEGQAFTSYSTIYNLTDKTFRLYNLGNFKEVLEFNLADELAKGRHAHKLEKLFQHSPSLEAVQRAARKYDTEVAVPVEELSGFAGRYQPEGMADVVIVISLKEERLHIGREGESNVMPMYPESAAGFRFADESGQLRFESDASGAVTGFLIMRGGDHFAKRLPE